FLEAPAGMSDHIGQAKVAAYFHELTPRYDHFFVASEGGDRKHHCRCIIVDDNCRFTTRDQVEHALNLGISVATLSCSKVQFQIAITAQYLLNVLAGKFWQRCATQIRIDDDA